MTTNPIPLAAALLTSLLISGAYAQDAESPEAAEPPSRTVFKLSPQHFTVSSLKAGIERFNPHYSGSFSIMITGRLEKEKDPFDNTGYNGLGAELQFRKYISPMKARTSKAGNHFHQGVYGALYLQGGFFNSSYSDSYDSYDPNTGAPTQIWYQYEQNISNGGLGFTIGYQKTVWQVVFLEAFIGGGIQFAGEEVTGYKPSPVMFDTSGGITDPAYEGIMPKIGVNIGIGL